MFDTGHFGLWYSLLGQLESMLHEMDDALAKKNTERPALPLTGLCQRDQKARVAAFRGLMQRYPIEIITCGPTAPIMGSRLQPAIEHLPHALETSPPRFLQSRSAPVPNPGSAPA